jgi:predicted phosphate transport protein (TIGR00153 family)
VVRLLPRDQKFFDLFTASATYSVQAARYLSELLQKPEGERAAIADTIKKLERQGDEVTHEVVTRLDRTFITPLDREDIRALASDLDDILDYMESVAQYLVLFELHESPEALRQFASILVAMVQEIDKATRLVWDLTNEKEIQASIVRISELENQGDALYNTVIADLFKRLCHDSVEIMKWKEVYDGLEEACDGCKDFTHVLGNVVIKNA